MEAEKAKKYPLMEVFNDSVKTQINDDRNHGWGNADSLVVIENVIAEDATLELEKLIAAGKPATAYTPSEEALKLIALVVNPSAFRQKLETAKRPDGQTVLAKTEKKEKEKAILNLYS